MLRLAKVQVSVVLRCMVQIVRWPMRSTPYHGGAIKKYFRGHEVATQRQTPATTRSYLCWYHYQLEPYMRLWFEMETAYRCSSDYNIFRPYPRTPEWSPTSVTSQLIRLTVPPQGLRSPSHPAWSDGCQEVKRMSHEGGGGRRLLQFISSKVFQYL